LLGEPNLVSDLSRADEDFLEAVFVLRKEKGSARISNIATNLGISMPSTNEKTRQLSEQGLVDYKKYGPVELTEKGTKIAKKVYCRHELLYDFFKFLGTDEKNALEDACRAEHVLSKKTISKIKDFMKNKRVKK
jgi:DtxR family transcriptional regulator, Mn-dependent transcriptional regulator